MPTTRKRKTRKLATRITPAAVAAFKAGDDRALYEAIGQRPWEPSPLDVDDGPPPRPHQAEVWAKAQELRSALEAAVAETE